MALDETTIEQERKRWNDIGSLGNAIANLAKMITDGYYQSPYDAELKIPLTTEQRQAAIARVKALRDELKAKIQESEIAKL